MSAICKYLSMFASLHLPQILFTRGSRVQRLSPTCSMLNNTAAQSPATRFRRRSLLRPNGIPDHNDILAKHVRWARVRYYFLNRRRHVRSDASIRAAVDALESHSDTLPLATDALELGAMTDMHADLLHVGSQFV